MNIKAEIKKCKESIRLAEVDRKCALLKLQSIQEMCQHKNKESWTNNDGWGQFKVERCKDCGLQKDGGLPNAD
jgi:hypothetical protein